MVTGSALSRTPGNRHGAQGYRDVSLCVHPSAPAPDLDGAEHVVEADLGLPGGDLAICGHACGNSEIKVLPQVLRCYLSLA